MEFDIPNEQLQFFERFLNDHLYGLKFDQLNPSMMQNLAVALGSYMMTLSPLLYEMCIRDRLYSSAVRPGLS